MLHIDYWQFLIKRYFNEMEMRFEEKHLHLRGKLR